jgi:pimeloyl-ACP methyl ester carboxylesterase
VRGIRGVALLSFALSAGAAVPAPQEGGTLHEIHVQVGDATVRALCTDGPRRVILLHGESATADTWRGVLERLPSTVGACAYDRPGDGNSWPVPPSRGWFELMDDMRRIHAALGFEPGYTLVGHSIGGLYARLFAAERPGDVGGLVLIEPAHEDLPDAVRPGMPDADWKAWMRERAMVNTDGVKETDLAERARGSHLPDIPVTVITATRRRQGTGWDERFLNEAARQVDASILRGITMARQVPASRSGHDVQLEQPDLVAAEIVRVVRISKGGEP